jgi:GTP pyrophosphokinase
VKRRRLEKPDDAQLLAVAKQLSLADVRQLIASIGQGDVHVSQVFKLLYPEAVETPEPPAKAASAFERLVDRMRGTTRGVRIQGVDGLMIRYSQCCQPVPGDPVVGYVTRGRGVSIHRADCPNLLLLSAEPERRLEIDWQEMEGELFVVRLGIEANDRRGLYADLAGAVTETGTNIKSLEMRSGDGGVFGSVLVEVENLSHLQKIVKAIRRVKGVTDVARRERVAAE